MSITIEKINMILDSEEFCTFQRILKKLGVTKGEYKEWSKKHLREAEMARNGIIDNILTGVKTDPRRTPISKFYLEAYDNSFFGEKRNSDDSEITIFFGDDTEGYGYET